MEQKAGIHPPIQPNNHPIIQRSFYPAYIKPSTHPAIQPTQPFNHPSIHPPTHPSIQPTNPPTIHLPTK
ncbi:spore coat protein SP85-like [Penaeus japonicus]|uniref:spore coat protein SP85-like n=1 Tax=Penaeus japonicus TaxID=27405 RepID=UPI001C710D0A|nr:spore coat protein SP85-like [Penaeus japonicus]